MLATGDINGAVVRRSIPAAAEQLTVWLSAVAPPNTGHTVEDDWETPT
jgi:hypothetical protein